jgi:hypothetical protein
MMISIPGRELGIGMEPGDQEKEYPKKFFEGRCMCCPFT